MSTVTSPTIASMWTCNCTGKPENDVFPTKKGNMFETERVFPFKGAGTRDWESVTRVRRSGAQLPTKRSYEPARSFTVPRIQPQ
jgi:hypothetical protein